MPIETRNIRVVNLDGELPPSAPNAPTLGYWFSHTSASPDTLRFTLYKQELNMTRKQLAYLYSEIGSFLDALETA